jgi:hypothetical protein
MVEKHDTDTELFRLIMSILIGVFVGALVAQAASYTPIILASATISGGITLGLLRAYDP